MTASKTRLSMVADRDQGVSEALVWLAPGARLHLRRGQLLPLDRLGCDDILCVESGCLALKAETPGGASRVVEVLYPDDMISREAAPPLPAIGLTAALPATVLRLPQRPDVGAGATDDRIVHAFARLAARTALHAIVLSELTAEQRIATFLVEMALRSGGPTDTGCTFELPLSRTDIAHYLALNPDTTSRLVSRLRQRGLFTSPARGWVMIPDFETLAAMSPLTATLRVLCRTSDAGTRPEAAAIPAT